MSSISDSTIGLATPGTSHTNTGIDAATPSEWFNDLNSGSELKISEPVAPDLVNPRSYKERTDMIMAPLLGS